MSARKDLMQETGPFRCGLEEEGGVRNARVLRADIEHTGGGVE